MLNSEQNMRGTKKIYDYKTIKTIIIKYIDINRLNIKSPDFCKEMTVHDYFPDTGTFLISIKNANKVKNLVIYTILAERYIEFNLELFSISGEGYPEGSYEYKVAYCNLAANMREKTRFDVNQMPYSINKISFPKIKETQTDILDNLSIKIIIKTAIKKLEEFSLKEYYHIREYGDPMNEDIMPELAYALEAGGLYIKNLSDPGIFLKESQKLFKRTRIKDLEKKLRSRIQELSKNYISLLIEPIEYITTLGEFITLGYVILGTKNRIIDDDILNRTNIALLKTSKILKYGNYITLNNTGNILDISENGILVEFQHKEPIEYMIEHEAMLFDLILGKSAVPIRVSGTAIYIISLENGMHHVGINFQGSQFGPGLKRQILLNLERDFKVESRTA